MVMRFNFLVSKIAVSLAVRHGERGFETKNVVCGISYEWFYVSIHNCNRLSEFNPRLIYSLGLLFVGNLYNSFFLVLTVIGSYRTNVW
jgi:hypothetical protein